jgi:hypothetical protein
MKILKILKFSDMETTECLRIEMFLRGKGYNVEWIVFPDHIKN